MCTIGDYRRSDQYNSNILTDFKIKLNALSTEIFIFGNLQSLQEDRHVNEYKKICLQVFGDIVTKNKA